MNRAPAYLNGDWIDAHDLSLSVDDLGFALGATVVERLRTFAGQPYRVTQHLARLRRSLAIVGWDADRLCDEVGEAIAGYATRIAPFIQTGDDWSIAAFVTPGLTADASTPTVCVHGRPLPFANWAAKFTEGESVCITDVRQTPANCWPPELKCRSRMHYYLADREAARRCPGARAVLLDQQGFVAEASTANVVAYFHDRGLATPRRAGVLPGVSQEALFELADELAIPHREQDLLPHELAAADEVYLSSTSICLLPVVRQDGKPIGDGRPGPIYRRLLAQWSQRVGVDVADQAQKFALRAG
jgi:branched-subunit amino acid aminotransferase/4-amino-4-deoxychorismate lyase